ncbi:ribosomal protein S18-alanine N-acetyltransferase [archaeon]|nr:ribosomal protein S18-alanine N-acetyltransferase [archaeon]
MKIRIVESEDLWDVARIENQAFKKPWTFPRFVEQYETNKEGFLVAEDKKVIGFSVTDPNGLLMLLAVDDKHKGKGIGSELLKAALDFLKSLGVSKAYSHVRKSNEQVIKFYEKHGFKKEKELPHYYSDEDGWLLTKQLG